MTLASLVKTKANRVLGIDASTNSIAFCLLENNIPIKWGKINLNGNNESWMCKSRGIIGK